jgi:hypothetical protein
MDNTVVKFLVRIAYTEEAQIAAYNRGLPAGKYQDRIVDLVDASLDVTRIRHDGLPAEGYVHIVPKSGTLAELLDSQGGSGGKPGSVGIYSKYDGTKWQIHPEISTSYILPVDERQRIEVEEPISTDNDALVNVLLRHWRKASKEAVAKAEAWMNAPLESKYSNWSISWNVVKPDLMDTHFIRELFPVAEEEARVLDFIRKEKQRQSEVEEKAKQEKLALLEADKQERLAVKRQQLAEATSWIHENGSERLRKIVEHGFLDASMAVYRDERIKKELSGNWVYDSSTFDEIRNPQLAELEALDEARKNPHLTEVNLAFCRHRHDEDCKQGCPRRYGPVLEGQFIEDWVALYLGQDIYVDVHD